MSASPLTSSHSSNAFSSRFFHKSKIIPTPRVISIPPKIKFIICSSFPAHNSKSTKIDDSGSGKFSVRHFKTIKAPTAPWMKEPLLVKPNEILEFRKKKPSKDSGFGLDREHHDMDLTGKVGGGRGRLAMKKIYKGIDELQERKNLDATEEVPENFDFKFAPGELWGDKEPQNPAKAEEISGVFVDESSELFDSDLGEADNAEKKIKLPWERDEKMVIRRINKGKIPTTAELSLDAMLLERLRDEAAKIKKWVKVKKLGVTQVVVDQIRLVWRDSELALLKLDLPLSQNMYRAREIVEMKTGGFVVWTRKDFLAVYRGSNYLSGPKHIWRKDQNSFADNARNSSSLTNYGQTSSERSNLDSMNYEGSSSKLDNGHQPSLYEREADRLLDGLGPRFVDWWMSRPLPVDADLLPEVVPGFKTPFRLCPPHTRSKLTDSELTYLRKLAHPLPTHFVLGRNRKLQGLAAAIIKLWEKCHTAKIALKWGIPNTDNEQMAYELKILTGGVLLLRNKFFIILYRGKDFLTPDVANLVNEREMELTRWQDQEEAARLRASETIPITDEDIPDLPGIVGTLSEFHNIQSESEKLKKANNKVEVKLEMERERLEKELKDQEHRLFILKKKIEKSAIILEELKSASRFTDKDLDKEIISDEERSSFQEMGLKIDSSLVLGRRGIYDGVIEGIHQHWKHKEVVKVVTMQRKCSQVMYTAELLEAESGGILISVVKIKEGHAIILYRGKNYKRPKIVKNNLLTKREAFSRSLELQRMGSLKFFARQREHMIYQLKQKLERQKAELSE